MSADAEVPGWKPIRSSLSELLRRSGLEERFKAQAVFDAYRTVAGTALCSESEPVRYRNGELEIHVRSSSLLHELQHFKREKLLSEMKKIVSQPEIKSLRFGSRKVNYYPYQSTRRPNDRIDGRER